MTITAKFPSKCANCGAKITPGTSIEWTRGSKTVTHTNCPGDGYRPTMDADNAIAQAEDFEHVTTTRRQYVYGSNYARFSSGAEVYTNRRGRCEDAPCCGCCS